MIFFMYLSRYRASITYTENRPTFGRWYWIRHNSLFLFFFAWGRSRRGHYITPGITFKINCKHQYAICIYRIIYTGWVRLKNWYLSNSLPNQLHSHRRYTWISYRYEACEINTRYHYPCGSFNWNILIARKTLN